MQTGVSYSYLSFPASAHFPWHRSNFCNCEGVVQFSGLNMSLAATNSTSLKRLLYLFLIFLGTVWLPFWGRFLNAKIAQLLRIFICAGHILIPIMFVHIHTYPNRHGHQLALRSPLDHLTIITYRNCIPFVYFRPFSFLSFLSFPPSFSTPNSTYSARLRSSAGRWPETCDRWCDFLNGQKMQRKRSRQVQYGSIWCNCNKMQNKLD